MWTYGNTLSHVGVKGMHWGHRKAISTLQSVGRTVMPLAKVGNAIRENTRVKTKSANYTIRQQQDDKFVYGRKGVKRIDKRMAKGDTHKKAATKEFARQTLVPVATAAALTAGLLAAPYLASKANKVAYEKGMQKANASLAKIGPMKLKHIAKDVYEYRMK